MFCLHPSGGDATAYLRLRALLGDDVPLYAVQSRATSAPEREHTTLAAMAADYAEVIRAARPGGCTADCIAHRPKRRLPAGRRGDCRPADDVGVGHARNMGENMTAKEVGKKLVDLCTSGHFFEAIDTLYADRLGERVEQLAHHALRGEMWDAAAAYAQQAGARAAARSVHRQARRTAPGRPDTASRS